MRRAFALLCSLALAAAGTSPAFAGGNTLKYSGQLLDVENNYAFFTTGDAFKLSPTVRVVDAKTGDPIAAPPHVKQYVRATFEGGSGLIVELALSKTKLPQEAPIEAIRQFVTVASRPQPNPELANNGDGRTGRPVSVVFTVQVPPRTPLGDVVYMSTDQSNWDAQAIRMDRVDALHYRIRRNFSSGTKLQYLYTRGSWPTGERGPDGLSPKPRAFDVREGDTLTKSDVVANWADQNQSAPDIGPNSEPTPFNQNPFPFNTPSPTPRPRAK
jgi:hypothetical protein